MSALLLLILGHFQGHYYIDGTEIHLDDGTIIKTSSEVKMERLFYTWFEEGVAVSVSRDHVRTINYFSMRVEGQPPLKIPRSRIQRRLSGKSVLYESNGNRFLKFRHVDGRGRSAEGRSANVLKVLQVHDPQANETYRAVSAQFAKTQPGSQVTFRFYNLRGELQTESSLSIDKKKGRGEATYSFEIPANLDVAQLGLVEVISQR